MTAASTERHASSPAPPQDHGVVLTAGPRPHPNSPLILHGAFYLTLGEAGAFEGSPQRAVALLVMRRLPEATETAAYMPFSSLVLFADDHFGVPGGVQGHFNIDVSKLMGGVYPGDYHFVASIGPRLSSALRVIL